MLGAVSACLAIASVMQDPSTALIQFYTVVFAMGMVNAAVEHVEGLPIGLTYVTGALSRFGRGIGRFLLGERKVDWSIQIVPWLGMISGALCGAVLSSTMQSMALWVVAAIATSSMRPWNPQPSTRYPTVVVAVVSSGMYALLPSRV